MSSFFEKLKVGMGINGEPAEEEKTPTPKERKPREKKPVIPKTRMLKIQEIPPELDAKQEQSEAEKEKPESKTNWLKEPAGQLQIDVYQTENDLVIQSAIAGVKSENLEIAMEKDVLTISGEREKPIAEEGDYLTKECYWGSFSREIIMPVEVDPDRIEAQLKVGVLTIRLPKTLREKKRKISVKI